MKRYATAEYSLHLRHPGLAGRSVTLAYFSDLHNCCAEHEAEEIERRIAALRPDLILCGGDSIVASPGKSVREAASFLRNLTKRYPLYIGTGNHEYRARIYPETYGSMYASYLEILAGTENLFLLENKEVTASFNGIPLRICGFDLPRKYYRRVRPESVGPEAIRSVFGDPDSSRITILLSHNPATMPACMEWGADLSLFGHYHGGIMRIGEHGGLISPEFRLFPGDVYGHFQNNGKHGIISSGCGEHTLPLRIRNPREIVGIRIYITD